MPIVASSRVRTVCDAWIEVTGGNSCKVYAEHIVGDGIIEIFGYTGNSADGELREFVGLTVGRDFAATIKCRGHIIFEDCDNLGGGDWALVDIIDTTGWND